MMVVVKMRENWALQGKLILNYLIRPQIIVLGMGQIKLPIHEMLM